MKRGSRLAMLLFPLMLGGCAIIDADAGSAGGTSGYTFAATDAFPIEMAGGSGIDDFAWKSTLDMASCYGKLVARFGSPRQTSVNSESAYSYNIVATDAQGNRLYLEAYHGPSGPAVGGQQTPESTAAAKALIAYVEKAKPADCEYRGYYMDYDVHEVFGVKDGKPYAEETPLTEEEAARVRDVLFDDAFKGWPTEEEFERVYRERFGIASSLR